MGVLNNRWFFGGAGDEPQPIANIGNSLRFRNACRLNRTTTAAVNGDWTISFWFKPETVTTRSSGGDSYFFMFGTYLATLNLYMNNNSSASASWGVLGNQQLNYAFAGMVRDPGAWYHCVIHKRDGVTQGFMNGVGPDFAYNGSDLTIASGVPLGIGASTDGATPSDVNSFKGYMADWYFIDGQALEPTAFGLYDEEGVWVPRQVDFTPATPRYSDFVTGDFDPTGTTTSLPTLAFDGNTATRFFGLPGGTCEFAPETAIPFTGFRVFGQGNANSFYTYDGTTRTGTNTSGAWIDFSDVSGQFDTTTPLIFGSDSGSFRPELNAIEITDANGTRILVNPFIYSGDSYTAANGSSGFDFTGRDKNFATGVNAITAGFDGNTGTFAFAQADQSINILLNAEGVNSVVVRTDQTQTYSFAINETEVTATRVIDGGGALQTLDLPAGFDGNLTMLSIRGSTALMTPGFSNIQINGQTLVDGVNNSYGSQGFHLDFADTTQIGKDVSGNNNDFTNQGFNFDPVGIFSDFEAGSTSTYESNPANRTQPLINPGSAFDGNTAGGTQVNGGGGGYYYFTKELTNITGFRVWTLPSSQTVADFRLNGTTVAFTNSGNYSIADAPPSTITEFAWRRNIDNTQTFQIEIQQNGSNTWVPLIDNTGEDYDSMVDSPSQNYATLNPLIKTIWGPNGNTTEVTQYQAANMRAGHSGSNPVLSGPTQYLEKIYLEIGPTTNANERNYPGLIGFDLEDYWEQDESDMFNVLNTGQLRIPGQSTVTVFDPWFQNDIARVKFDGSTRILSIAVNDGAFIDRDLSAFIPAGTKIGLGLQVFNNDGIGCINYGQSPFKYDVPTGFSVSRTGNMPSAPIPNGTDHFRAVTGDGASILDIARANLNGFFGDAGFSEGLWWIKASNTANTNQHQLLDSLNANSAVRLPGPTSPATYTPPTGDSVAWCWRTTEAYTDASIDSGRRNPTAGFSHFNYTGDGNNTRDLAHGLGAPPDWVIIFDPGANDVKCFVRGLAGTGSSTNNLILSTSEAAGNVFSAGIIYNPDDDDTFTVGLSQSPTNVNSVNQLGVEYRAYCWRNIDGYSHFGHYQGNQNATDQTFVYTGFKPSFVMIKNSNSGPWMMFDSTRSPQNVAIGTGMDQLQAQSTAGEIQESQNTLDFCSNGFKIRGNGGNINGEADKMYMAFAQCPFGGSNVNPATGALFGPPQMGGITAGISRSLRFKNGDQVITRTQPAGEELNGTDWCASFWLKSTNPDSGEGPIFCLGTGAPENWFLSTTSGLFSMRNSPSGYERWDPDIRRRDPSAWYHVYFEGTTANVISCWVNGVRQVNTITMSSMDRPINFGHETNDGVGQGFEGYLADIYLVGGSHLGVGTFAEYNDDGVWVPIEDPTIDDYGVNGFKLVLDPAYQDGTTLLDQSGNENNFTLVNVDTDDYFSADFDWMKDGPSQNYATGNPLMHGRNGGTRIMSYTDANLGFLGGGPSSLPWTHPGIRVPTGVRAYAEFTNIAGAITAACGVSERRPTTDSDWGSRGCWSWALDTRVWVVKPDGTTDTVNVPGRWTGTAGDVAGVEVNTTVTPPTVTFTLNGTNASTHTFNADFDPENIWIGGNFGVNQVAQNFGQQPFSHQPTGTIALRSENLPAATITNGRDHFRVITQPGTGGAAGGRNGNWLPDLYSAPPGDRAQAHVSTSNIFQPNAEAFLAFDGDLNTVAETWQNAPGGRPGWMSFRPSDTSLSELTASTSFKIKVRRIAELWVNGTQMTGDFTTNTGSLFDLSSQLTFPFTLESFEIGAIAGQDAGLFGIELDGQLLVQDGILEVAQETFTNGLWWVKDRDNDSTQHQLVDSVRGSNLAIRSPGPTAGSQQEIAYAAPTGDSVAWCWNAGDTSTNGFNIITWTGTGGTADRNIPHGLGGDCAMFIAANRDNNNSTDSIGVAHQGLGAGEMLCLNAPDTPKTNVTYGSGVVGLGDATNVLIQAGTAANIEQDNYNRSGLDYVGYVWREITGYSAFGSYTGNSSTNGPFIYTGFRPAFVMFKRTDASANWEIFDTTRSPANPLDTPLYANREWREPAPDALTNIDFLSNGFKQRNGQSNSNQGSFIYAAFAENPFGGSNVSPVTAR